MIEIDLGVIIIALVAAILGALVNFFQRALKKEMTARVTNFKNIIEDIKSNKEQIKDIKNLRDIRALEIRKRLKGVVKGRLREFFEKYNVTWSLSMFFGIVACILYLLVTNLDQFSYELGKPLLNFIIGSFSAGYAGETFVEKILANENPYENIPLDDIRNAFADDSSEI